MVTIKDVAREAKVSVPTVSRALSENGYVSDAARRKIELAIKKLGYVPNRLASGLASGRTMSIGMIVPDIASVFFAEVALGAETTATKAGYILTVCNTNGSLDQEKHLLNFLHQARVDGIILAGGRLPDNELLPAVARHPTFVSINRPVPPDLGGSIVTEHAKGMVAAVEHVVRLKRKTIAFMAGPEHSYSADERLRGFLQAMKAFELPINPGLIVPNEANYENGCRNQYEWFNSVDAGSSRWHELRAQLGARGAHGLLANHPEVDAVVCFNDNLAFGALRACAELGRRVPEDVAIIGCDDISLASQVTPTLTTQRVPRYAIGKRAVQMLIERINGNREQATVVFPHELIIRESAPVVS
ncbi:MAG: LacI family DNA-binding transcriptional regulator [Chloroflexi bacterium]|nr:LacI family DNA-binding transcriptional regulator [Chloroflexota bacterium]